MTLYRDREDGGRQLVPLLQDYADRDDVVVVGLPRGGVITAAEVAKALHLPLDITCPRKIGYPGNPEYAIGAVSEAGEYDLNQKNIPEEYLREEIALKQQEAKKRLALYRKGLPARTVSGKVVILVDDGLATGSTMKAAIRSLKAEGAAALIVAVPVAPPDTLEAIAREVDAVHCPATPANFTAVGQFYTYFAPTSDEEVIAALHALISPEETN